MSKHLIFGIHGNEIVQGNNEFFKSSFKKALEKCNGKVDIHLEGISMKNIEKNKSFFHNCLLTDETISSDFELIYNLDSEKNFNQKVFELNSLLYDGHFIPDLFEIGDILISDPIRFNLYPEKQNLSVDFYSWKYVFLNARLEQALDENISPTLVVMDFLKSQVDSLFARDVSLADLINNQEEDKDIIVLRGFLHSPSKKFISSEGDTVYEDLINDEILKAYYLHLNHELDNDKLLELSKSYLETYKRLRNINNQIKLEQYKKLVLNN